MPARPAALDAASLRILECLQQDSEISVADLAERVGLSNRLSPFAAAHELLDGLS